MFIIFRNPCSVGSSLDCESLGTLNSGGSTQNLQPTATSELHAYLNNSHGEESISCALASSENFSGTFDDCLNSRYPGSVEPDQPIDNPGNPCPFFYSASMDGTLISNTTDSYTLPTLDTGMHVSLMNQHVSISAGRQASNRRRRRVAEHRYDVCGQDFTAAHNLQCCTCSLITVLPADTHLDHRNIHYGLRPYPCEHRYLGCDYAATARSTATRHSGTCRYRP